MLDNDLRFENLKKYVRIKCHNTFILVLFVTYCILYIYDINILSKNLRFTNYFWRVERGQYDDFPEPSTKLNTFLMCTYIHMTQ